MASSCADEEQQQLLQANLAMIPQISKRTVVGWWMGSTSEFEDLLRTLKTEV